MTNCLSDDAVLAFVAGQLSAAELEAAEGHLATCRDCHALVAEAARADGSSPVPAVEWPPPIGAKVGRYELLAPVGAGASSVVYRAHDPRLKREVALKLLPPASSGAPSPDDQQLLAEAEALARLSHPNVVSVFDAGFDGCVYIALELVGGHTLSIWRRQRRRSWRDVASVFAAAAEGLAAAHAAGLVHRDFKPENVLIDDRGLVKVTDFGLARAPGDATSAGTPLYMAPEVMLRTAADARSDQFSFCVALFEALYDTHPFLEGDGAGALESLVDAVTTGAVRSPPAVNEPPALRSLVLRGLALAPGDRHPSMQAIARDLRSVAAGAGRPWKSWLAAAGLAVATIAGAALVVRSGGAAPVQLCGNGLPDPGEDCDDGNRDDGDGCTTGCLACSGGDASLLWSDNGHCYRRFDTPRSWSQARAICHERGGDLASFTGIHEVRAAVTTLLPKVTSFWIGLRADRRSAMFTWVTGEPLVIAPWIAGQPGGGAACVQQVPGRGEPIRGLGVAWTTSACDGEAAFVCETAPWIHRAGHAYKLFTVPASWAAARAACAAAGGHLATLTDADEQAFAASITMVRAWIGATKESREGRFGWVTGEPFAFQRFGPREPDDRDGTKSCVAQGPDPVWHDRVCAEQNAYLCELDGSP